MVSEFDKKKLRFVVAPTRFATAANGADLVRAYECWRRVWSHALCEEMNIKEPLYSDNFTRQSHVAILFYGEIPLGLTTLNILDLTFQQDLDDSYFKVWPQATLEELKQNNSVVMTCCNATLNFEFRKGQLSFSAKDLLFAMLIKYIQVTKVDSIVGTPRLEKGVEKACYRTGAISLAKNLPYTIPGQYIDLVCWKRNLDQNNWDPIIKELADHIWNNSTEIVQIQSQKGERYAA